jgi:hypothetical protein
MDMRRVEEGNQEGGIQKGNHEASDSSMSFCTSSRVTTLSPASMISNPFSLRGAPGEVGTLATKAFLANSERTSPAVRFEH